MKILKKRKLNSGIVKIKNEREDIILNAMLKGGISSYPSSLNYPFFIKKEEGDYDSSYTYLNSPEDIPSDKEIFTVREIIKKKARKNILKEIKREIKFYNGKLKYISKLDITDPLIQSKRDRVKNRLFKLYGLVNILNFKQRSFLAKGANVAYTHRMIIEFLEKEF